MHESVGPQSDPVEVLRLWIAQAAQAGCTEPNAMCLCTSTRTGHPSARIVLLRGLEERGVVFYTNYGSRKARELDENPIAAAVLYWPEIERQVRLEGAVEKIAPEDSDRYFAARPRGHQLGAWASEQSEPLDDPAHLQQRFEDYAARFEGESVPRPHSWGGYVLRPERVEMWSARPNRLHERVLFSRAGGEWRVQNLQP